MAAGGLGSRLPARQHERAGTLAADAVAVAIRAAGSMAGRRALDRHPGRSRARSEVFRVLAPRRHAAQAAAADRSRMTVAEVFCTLLHTISMQVGCASQL